MLIIPRPFAFTSPAAVKYLVREEDGTSKITLEEGGGSILLEEST